MMKICRCENCKEQLQSIVDGFDGKTLFISLDIQRFHSMCKECKHQNDLHYRVHFCKIECLKEYVTDPEKLDKYVKDEVYWGRFYEMNPHMKDGPV